MKNSVWKPISWFWSWGGSFTCFPSVKCEFYGYLDNIFYNYKLAKYFSQIHNFDHKQVLSLGLSSPALLLHGLLQAPIPEDENQVVCFSHSPFLFFFTFFFIFFFFSFFLLLPHGSLQAPVPEDENQVALFSPLFFYFFIFFLFFFSFTQFATSSSPRRWEPGSFVFLFTFFFINLAVYLREVCG